MHVEGIPSPELLQAWLPTEEARRGRGLEPPRGRDVTAVLTVYLFKALTYWGSLEGHMPHLLQIKKWGGGHENDWLVLPRSWELCLIFFYKLQPILLFVLSV